MSPLVSPFGPGPDPSPLTTEDIDRAAAVVGQMAAIPALQRGYADFDEALACSGWSERGDDAIIVSVGSPEDTDDDRRARVRAGIRRLVEHLRVEAPEQDPDAADEFRRHAEIIGAVL